MPVAMPAKRKNRRWLALLVVPAVAVAVALPAAAQAQPPPLVEICQAPPCPSAQEFEVFDGYGAPIFSVGEYGGAGVFGDNFGVFGGGDVFHPVAQLRDNGTMVLRGQVLTPADIGMLHLLERAHVTLADLRWLVAHAH